jgi:hypothetical protein
VGWVAKIIHLLVAKGREPLHVLVADRDALPAQVLERALHVERVPEQDAVDHEPERAQLILLALAVGLAGGGLPEPERILPRPRPR